MAKALLLVVAALLMVAVAAEATAPAPAAAPHKSSTNRMLSMKLILHNVGKRPVTFQLMSPVASSPVAVLKGKWNAIEAAPFSAQVHSTVAVSVTAENNKREVVSKTVKIKLLQHFKAAELKGKKFLVMTAVESWSWKNKYLLITMGEVVVLSIKL